MAPRGDISRPQRWDPDGGPWEDYTEGPRTLSISLLIALFKVPKKSSICGVSHICDRGVKVAGMPFSPCLSPSQLVCLPPSHIQSVSKLSRTYLMVFIYPFHVGF